MSVVNKYFVLFLVTHLFVCQVRCIGIERTYRSSKSGNRLSYKYRNKSGQYGDPFSHKLGNSPLASMHIAPQALELPNNTISPKYEQLGRRNKRYISQADLLNPQRPRYKKNIVNEDSTTRNNNDSSGAIKRFHHPGHSSELSSNYPANNYNYYKVFNRYGSNLQYESRQPLQAYTQTSNIGIVPPKGINAKDYYNSISNLDQYPMISQHSLYHNWKQVYSYGYGYSDRSYVKNAYRNALTGLAIWAITNGLVNGKRYAIYDYKTLPDDYVRNISLNNETVTQCFDAAIILCGDRTQHLCINNDTVFCVSSEIVSCPETVLGVGNRCANITIPCDDCKDNQTTYLPCAANITITREVLNKQKFNISDNSDSFNSTELSLCVTSLVIPQLAGANEPPCSTPYCVENKARSKLKDIVENTTAIA